MEIRDITLTPSFPEPGKELLIEAEGIIKDPIQEGAYVQVTVKIGVVTLIRRTFDLCEEMQKNDVLDCPVRQGPTKASIVEPSSHDHHIVLLYQNCCQPMIKYRSPKQFSCQRRFQR